MKRLFSGLLVSSLALTAFGQSLEKVYDRDTMKSFRLKNYQTDTLVKGPMVKQRSVFVFDNPEKKLSEASIWFTLSHPSVLGGFGYWYKDEYVPGVLMDKKKAWNIYTAITDRNEDPGIMTQTNPSSYHAQIYPLAVGHDLRFELTTLGFLKVAKEGLLVPEPFVQDLEGEKNNFFRTTSVPTDRVAREVRINGKPSYRVEGGEEDSTTLDYYAQKFTDGRTYVVGMIRTDHPDNPFVVKGLSHVMWARPEDRPGDGTVKVFVGIRRGAGKIEVVSEKGNRSEILKGVIHANERGSDTAKLWAHQKLVNVQYGPESEIKRLSMKFQIPSSQTALLAVPKEQMKLFREKEAEYQRQQREEARQRREWANERPMNWNQSTGGDPEIRIQIPNVKSAKAELPDGRIVPLMKDGKGFWGGNFDIPANAPEGNYEVKVIGVLPNGMVVEKYLKYVVDRTAPTGSIATVDGFYVVKPSEPLAKAIAVMGSGNEIDMVPDGRGAYRIPMTRGRVVRVMMIDSAHNIGKAEWSH